MIIWTRFGILVPVIALGGFMLAEYSVELVNGDSAYYQMNTWPKLFGALLAAVPIWFLGQRLNRNATKLLLDPETGKEVWIDRKHTFFWVPMQYWSIIVLVVATAVTIGEGL